MVAGSRERIQLEDLKPTEKNHSKTSSLRTPRTIVNRRLPLFTEKEPRKIPFRLVSKNRGYNRTIRETMTSRCRVVGNRNWPAAAATV